MNQPLTPWYRELNRYHWFVLIVAALGWMFDCLDQQLFILARQPAMQDLLRVADPAASKAIVDAYAGYATSIFLIGWASGGLLFGVLGDRIGRAKTMVITILLYSLFTGLSALSVSFWDFACYRFLTGLGVGGEFAVGVALVAEVMPDRARPYALSLLQALSAFGNVTAALLNMAMGGLVHAGLVGSVWRPLFVVGAIPALLALLIRRRLREPERWEHVSHETSVARELGSYRALFGDPRWRRRALVGLGLAFSGVVGLWAVGFFTMDLVGNVLTARFMAGGLPPHEVVGRVAFWKGITSLMINLGAFFGMFGFGVLTQRIGRRAAFAIAFTAAFFSTAAVFAFLSEFWQIFVLVPIMGFCQLSLFAGYAIYFPELFPTYLRSTGTSFCYNVGRFVAAAGPTMLGLLTSQVYVHTAEPLRWAGLTMCSIFLLGLLMLPFAPETKDQPLLD
ncbi:MAG: MFS transporter [Pirellulaceae bacterium]|jgi:MFS family permease|nr:MFS transporter [Pirellulaceae bacterium]